MGYYTKDSITSQEIQEIEKQIAERKFRLSQNFRYGYYDFLFEAFTQMEEAIGNEDTKKCLQLLEAIKDRRNISINEDMEAELNSTKGLLNRYKEQFTKMRDKLEWVMESTEELKNTLDFIVNSRPM